jgi:predicted SnoaL-like aldol condensation-catalyzing enzyme
MCVNNKHCESGKLFYSIYRGETIDDFYNGNPLKSGARILDSEYAQKKIGYVFTRYKKANPNTDIDLRGIFASNDFVKLLEVGDLLAKYNHSELSKTELIFDFCTCGEGQILKHRDNLYRANKKQLGD